ncbi:MAG: dipicolinate synthase subunit B [Eubacteriales bacterium]|nr:dipicolinate synthase subunit B [Eubacteriales bacterium]
MIGYALCGSFCTHARSLAALEELLRAGYMVRPIVSETVYATDTRFGTSAALIERLQQMCGREVIHTIRDAEPLGPREKLDLLVIAPCTGNTLAKMCCGITDTAVTMAAKAQLRADRPVLVGIATNDALSANYQNMAELSQRRHITMLPAEPDDPRGKPHSLVCRFDLIVPYVRTLIGAAQDIALPEQM